jgi:hypothetical protein
VTQGSGDEAVLSWHEVGGQEWRSVGHGCGGSYGNRYMKGAWTAVPRVKDGIARYMVILLYVTSVARTITTSSFIMFPLHKTQYLHSFITAS